MNEAKQAKTFRKLIRKLFEIGPPVVELVANPGEVAVVASFGVHKVALGGYGADQLDAVLLCIMQARAAGPGGPTSDVLGKAWRALQGDPPCAP